MKFPCSKCNKAFLWKAWLARHLQTHEEDRSRKFMCSTDNCGKKFFSKKWLELHVRNTHSKWECNFCKAQLMTKVNLHNHIVAVHCREKAYKCGKCPGRFSTLTTLSSHTRTHNEKRVNCEICDKEFKSNYLIRHIRTEHQGLSKNRVSCSLCPKLFATNGNLRRHIRNHGSPSRFCYFCKKGFTDLTQLEFHTNTHTTEKPFFCSVVSCFYSSAYPECLRQHKLLYHPTPGQAPRKMLDCYFCAKRYPNTLGFHMRIHTLERPCPCPFCDRSFKCGSGLRRHIFSHTKEKPYKCSGCKISFAAKNDRFRHTLICRGHPKKCEAIGY